MIIYTGGLNDRIKELRILNKDTQADLAEKLGMSRSYISMLECGKREPQREELEAIADIYNVDMNYLYGKQSELNSHRLVTDAEFRLILAYRKASPEARAIIDRIVER